MSKFLLLGGIALMVGGAGRRLYLDWAGKWTPFIPDTKAAWLVSAGAIIFVVGILLGAAP